MNGEIDGFKKLTVKLIGQKYIVTLCNDICRINKSIHNACKKQKNLCAQRIKGDKHE